MTKKRASGKNVEQRLEQAKGALFDLRSELQESFISHDQRTAAILSKGQDRLKALLEEFQAAIKDSGEVLTLLAQKRDNIESRLRGRKPQHKNVTKSVQEILAQGRERLAYHQAGMSGLSLGEDIEALLSDIDDEIVIEMEEEEVEESEEVEEAQDLDDDPDLLDDLEALDDDFLDEGPPADIVPIKSGETV
jgi:hypothetical protein